MPSTPAKHPNVNPLSLQRLLDRVLQKMLLPAASRAGHLPELVELTRGSPALGENLLVEALQRLAALSREDNAPTAEALIGALRCVLGREHRREERVARALSNAALAGLQTPLSYPLLRASLVLSAVRIRADEPESRANLLLHERFIDKLLIAALAHVSLSRLCEFFVAVRGNHGDRLRVFVKTQPLAAHLRRSAQELTGELLTGCAPATDPPLFELYCRLRRLGLVADAVLALLWLKDGRVRERLWELTDAAVGLLEGAAAAQNTEHLRRSAYGCLQTTLDTAFTRTLAGAPAASELLSVLQGIVPVVGLSAWAQAIVSRAFERVDETVRATPAQAAFFGVRLDAAHARRLAYGGAVRPAAENAAAAIMHRLGRLARHYQAARERTDTASAAAVADKREIAALPVAADSLPSGLFVPAGFFAVSPHLWLGPLAALGLAAAADSDDKPLERYRAGAKTAHEGVVFALFSSEQSASWWLADEFSSEIDASDGSRERILKRFVRLDAMMRVLESLREEAAASRQRLAAQLLEQAGSLQSSQLSASATEALGKFLSPADSRRVRSACIVELVHGFVREQRLARDGFVSATGLEELLAAHKAQRLSRAPGRMVRLRRTLAASRPSPV